MIESIIISIVLLALLPIVILFHLVISLILGIKYGLGLWVISIKKDWVRYKKSVKSFKDEITKRDAELQEIVIDD